MPVGTRPEFGLVQWDKQAGPICPDRESTW
jgi:hypothetical protein